MILKLRNLKRRGARARPRAFPGPLPAHVRWCPRLGTVPRSRSSEWDKLGLMHVLMPQTGQQSDDKRPGNDSDDLHLWFWRLGRPPRRGAISIVDHLYLRMDFCPG